MSQNVSQCIAGGSRDARDALSLVGYFVVFVALYVTVFVALCAVELSLLPGNCELEQLTVRERARSRLEQQRKPSRDNI